MDSTFPQSHLIIYLKTLTVESLDKWSEIEDALRERKNVLKQELRETKALEKISKSRSKRRRCRKNTSKRKKDAEKTSKRKKHAKKTRKRKKDAQSKKD